MEALDRAGMKHCEYANSKEKLRSLIPDSKVLVLLPEKQDLLLISYQGPFEILEKKITNVDYIIGFKGKRKTFHVNVLKLFRDRPQYLQPIFGTCVGNCVSLSSITDFHKSNGDMEDNIVEKIQYAGIQRIEDHSLIKISRYI